MDKQSYHLVVGALLHDFGKLLYRYNDARNHSTSGYDYLKSTLQLDEEILQQVQYHHTKQIQGASLPKNALAYITYIADNIAAASDRRKAQESGVGFVRDIPQQSVFNLLNGISEPMHYAPKMLTDEINYPTDEKVSFDVSFYSTCIDNITDNLKGVFPSDSYLNSLLEILQANLTYVPSSTSLQEVADVSLFDHVKMTAAIAHDIYQYLHAKECTDYHDALYVHAQDFYNEKAFCLYSVDVSGIQDFIYNITSAGALKSLRARSFYLELMMENIVDNLLSRLQLTRANIIYAGGGHAYLLLANTNATLEILDGFEKEVNQWLLRTFKTALYLSGGYAICSANDLKNEPNGQYRTLFKTIANQVSHKKTRRYTAQDIITLNHQPLVGDERECSACLRTDQLLENNLCSVCDALLHFSKDIQKGAFYSVLSQKPSCNALPLPCDQWLVTDTKQSLVARMQQADYLRTYCKNEMYTGKDVATSLWVGDYVNGDDFSDFASASEGIERLGVLRADVDDLGKAFVQGFENETNKDYYVTLSRTATFSRKLSIFFKRHMNKILAEGTYFLTDNDDPARNATIVYSGGDDLFVVGAWSDIIGFAVDLQENLERFSQGKLTLSAGIGIYPAKYPVSAMAMQTGMLEEAAKKCPGKQAVAVFDETNVFSWNVFVNEILEDKYRIIYDFFSQTDQYGKGFLYKLLELLRNRDEKINIARYIYLLARMQPTDQAPQTLQDAYAQLSQNMYDWMKDETQAKQASLAIEIYVYSIRGTGENYDT